jgi:hypothetical protein
MEPPPVLEALVFLFFFGLSRRTAAALALDLFMRHPPWGDLRHPQLPD